MALNIRLDGDLAILSNFGRLMNDPAHFDASRDVARLLDDGYRAFVMEMIGVGELGSSGLGLLTTITRQVRQAGGELVLASVRRPLSQFLDEMHMDSYWETFRGMDEAQAFVLRRVRPRVKPAELDEDEAERDAG